MTFATWPGICPVVFKPTTTKRNNVKMQIHFQYEILQNRSKLIQSKDLGSNPSAVESVFLSTERFQILKFIIIFHSQFRNQKRNFLFNSNRKIKTGIEIITVLKLYFSIQFDKLSMIIIHDLRKQEKAFSDFMRFIHLRRICDTLPLSKLFYRHFSPRNFRRRQQSS